MTLAEVLDRGTGLYEVTTTDGVPVRLHDMSFLDLTYKPGPPTSLVARFRYDDPAWTPEAARTTPVAVFAFSDVLVVQHEDEHVASSPTTPASAFGQVTDFSYTEASGIFALQTFTTYLIFKAERVVLTLEADGSG